MSPSEIVPDERTILVSDWHLPPGETAQTEFFARFVDEVCTGAARLFVLGDLFAAWVGPRHTARPGHAAILEALRRLAASGTQVTLFRGNRDFLLDKRTVGRYGLRLARSDWRGALGGRRVRLSHGDELAEDDRLHKVARAVIGNFPASTLAKAMPLAASDWLAGLYRRISDLRRARRNRKALHPDERKLRAEFEAGTDVIVIGHWHQPGVQTDALGLPGKTFVMLGQCTDREASYAEIQGEVIQLKTFPGQP